jgi:hypothetical protein
LIPPSLAQQLYRTPWPEFPSLVKPLIEIFPLATLTDSCELALRTLWNACIDPMKQWRVKGMGWSDPNNNNKFLVSHSLYSMSQLLEFAISSSLPMKDSFRIIEDELKKIVYSSIIKIIESYHLVEHHQLSIQSCIPQKIVIAVKDSILNCHWEVTLQADWYSRQSRW